MGLDKLNKALDDEVNALKEKGTAKGKETIITGVSRAKGKKGPRYFLKGHGENRSLPVFRPRQC